MSNFTESVVEEAALEWLRKLGWATLNGADIAPDAANAERADYAQVVLAGRLRAALARLNPQLPAEAIEDAFRKLNQPQGATLEARNRAMHCLLVDGVTVEYRTPVAPFAGRRRALSISTNRTTTTSSPSTSSPSLKISTTADWTWRCLSTACLSRSLS
jgi:hypothetical protein